MTTPFNVNKEIDKLLLSVVDDESNIFSAKAQLIALIERENEKSDRKTLETVMAILNGDDNQVDTLRTYARNKLEMLALRDLDRHDVNNLTNESES